MACFSLSKHHYVLAKTAPGLHPEGLVKLFIHGCLAVKVMPGQRGSIEPRVWMLVRP